MIGRIKNDDVSGAFWRHRVSKMKTSLITIGKANVADEELAKNVRVLGMGGEILRPIRLTTGVKPFLRQRLPRLKTEIED